MAIAAGVDTALVDLQFVLHDVLGISDHYATFTGEMGIDRGTVDMVLEEINKFAQGELAPLNRAGDEGCRLTDG